MTEAMIEQGINVIALPAQIAHQKSLLLVLRQRTVIARLEQIVLPKNLLAVHRLPVIARLARIVHLKSSPAVHHLLVIVRLVKIAQRMNLRLAQNLWRGALSLVRMAKYAMS
ncbi:MAG: hypothetical protein II767_12725 [Proteobacteria bacterium]|nr:hypothetical protein [Pseudomonadota bacterium]